MKMLNNDPLDLSGDQDEKTTISVTSDYSGGPAYNMNLNGSTFTGPSFTLDKNVIATGLGEPAPLSPVHRTGSAEHLALGERSCHSPDSAMFAGLET